MTQKPSLSSSHLPQSPAEPSRSERREKILLQMAATGGSPRTSQTLAQGRCYEKQPNHPDGVLEQLEYYLRILGHSATPNGLSAGLALASGFLWGNDYIQQTRDPGTSSPRDSTSQLQPAPASAISNRKFITRAARLPLTAKRPGWGHQMGRLGPSAAPYTHCASGVLGFGVCSFYAGLFATGVHQNP